MLDGVWQIMPMRGYPSENTGAFGRVTLPPTTANTLSPGAETIDLRAASQSVEASTSKLRDAAILVAVSVQPHGSPETVHFGPGGAHLFLVGE
jgi:hypothetical protein